MHMIFDKLLWFFSFTFRRPCKWFLIANIFSSRENYFPPHFGRQLAEIPLEKHFTSIYNTDLYQLWQLRCYLQWFCLACISLLHIYIIHIPIVWKYFVHLFDESSLNVLPHIFQVCHWVGSESGTTVCETLCMCMCLLLFCSHYICVVSETIHSCHTTPCHTVSTPLPLLSMHRIQCVHISKTV